jgi:protein SCO1/2
LALMREKIGPSFDQLQVLFVTLDPVRDTGAVLGDYMSAQPIAVLGLTGPDSAIAAAVHNFGIFRERIAIPGQGYTIDHTASLFLLDRAGRRAGEIEIGASEEEFESKLRDVISGVSHGRQSKVK